MFSYDFSLRIQVCPKKGINPTILLWGWDWDHQTYSREGYGSLGFDCSIRKISPGGTVAFSDPASPSENSYRNLNILRFVSVILRTAQIIL